MVHVATAFAGTAQGVHDEPQVAGALELTQVEPHAWKPPLHANVQLEWVQLVLPLATAVHELEQLPQWFGALVRSTHCLPQRVGAAPVQPVVHWNEAPTGAQFGAAAPHDALHAPQ